MKSSPSAYILAKSSTGETRLFKGKIAAPPGFKWPTDLLDEGFEPILIGGFPKGDTGYEVPFSPALQVNGDISGLSDELLYNLARAELYRIGTQGFRAYTVEPERDVVVLSMDEDALFGFVNTWGGVLHVTPVLVGGSHRDLVSAKEIDVVVEEGGGLAIHIIEPSPIDASKCTLCGACLWQCQEGCISPGPFIDLNACTSCGNCVEACEFGAIDLHAATKRAFHPSFLVLLHDIEGDARFQDLLGLERPGPIQRIYRGQDMEGLFSHVFPHEIEEVIGLDTGICQYSPRMNKGCTRCMDVCEAQALMPGNDGIKVDHMACTECGACIGVCPTGAIRYERFTDKTFFHYLKILCDGGPGGKDHEGGVDWPRDRVLFITTGGVLEDLWWNRGRFAFAKGMRPFFIEHPEPRAISSSQLLFLMDIGFKKINLVVPDGHSSPPWGWCEIGLANEMGELVCGKKAVVGLFTKEAVMKALSSGDGLDDVVGELPASTHGSMQQALSRLDEFPGRRPLVSWIMGAYINRMGREGRLLKTVPGCEVRSPKGIPFQDLHIDLDRCSHCLACMNECRSGALLASEGDMTLRFTPILCVACGLCTDACPEEALSERPGLFLRQEFLEARALFCAEPARCIRCGKVFGVKKSLERVRAILASRGDMDSHMLELCEDCRVKWMFERDGGDRR